MYKNLVFEGGGVKGIAYAGALQVLQDSLILKDIDKVAGASAGAITATLVALGYTAEGIKIIVDNMNLPMFEDNANPLNIIKTFGIYRGNYCLNWIKTMIEAQTEDKDSTFRDLHQKGFKDLYIVASCWNNQSIYIFSFNNTPDVVVAEAVRASMSIPVLYDAFQFTKGIDTTLYFQDGGVLLNLPIEIFDTDGILNTETLGVCLLDYTGSDKFAPLKKWDLIKYIKGTFEMMISDQSARIRNNPGNNFRLIKLDDFGISPTEFGITENEKTKLYNSGIEYTKDFINKLKINLVS